MRLRIWAFPILVLLLITAAGCADVRIGRAPTVTPAPVKTLRPTFTSTPAKPMMTPTPAPVQASTAATQAPAAPAAPAATQPKPAPTIPAPASPTPAPSPTPQKASFTVSSPGATNVRSGPGTTYSRIGEVQTGQTYEITGKNQAGTWWQFSLNGQTGWISGEMVSANAAAGNVQVAANIPAAPAPTPVPVQPAPVPAPVKPTAVPPPPAAIFQGSAEFRNAETANFNTVTFWGRLGQTGDSPISGGFKMKVSSPFGGGEVVFGSEWQNADPGLPSQFRYNAKFEAPRAAGAFRVVVVDGSGKEVSDPITGALLDVTHDVILSWWPR